MENLVNSMVFDREPINLLLNADASDPSEKAMYVLTNTSKINGANALVQEELHGTSRRCFKGRLLCSSVFCS